MKNLPTFEEFLFENTGGNLFDSQVIQSYLIGVCNYGFNKPISQSQVNWFSGAWFKTADDKLKQDIIEALVDRKLLKKSGDGDDATYVLIENKFLKEIEKIRKLSDDLEDITSPTDDKTSFSKNFNKTKKEIIQYFRKHNIKVDNVDLLEDKYVALCLGGVWVSVPFDANLGLDIKNIHHYIGWNTVETTRAQSIYMQFKFPGSTRLHYNSGYTGLGLKDM